MTTHPRWSGARLATSPTSCGHTRPDGQGRRRRRVRAALPDGRAVAMKIADGANRARPPVMVAALRALDIDTSAIEARVAQWILGHGEHVGEVRAIAP